MKTMASDQRCIKSMNICLIIIILHHGHNYVAAVQILVIFRKNVEVTSLKAISNNTQIVAGRLNITGKYCFDSTGYVNIKKVK